ncbi:BTAD domain-containing putative transcriptional regulator [Lentzea sp. NPDC004782]|uniref:AfsR/SARP family transcriptional regulator n=1 Tax=Lentzea sp. NPDC004782 TaxID=3154458 RepID=UPI0033AD3C63
MPVQFRILGPLEVLVDGRALALGGPQQRALLGLLLLAANRVVSQQRLMTDLWGDSPPATVKNLLHGCVSGLRRVLPPGRLVTRSPGYLVRVSRGELDADEFERLAADDSVAAALELWRGPALHDLELDACRVAAARLDERRLAVLERRIDLDLDRGRFTGLSAELAALVREHPLRERFWAQLMVALSGTGRQSEALAAFRQLRAALVDQLGIEPSAVPRRVERAVLAGEDALAAYREHEPLSPAPDRPVPAQLPAAIAAFTGRAADLDRLDALVGGAGSGDLDARGAGEPPHPSIAIVAGAAGVGKTTLAVHWAHRVRDRFTDGQLYVNLRGHAPTPPVQPAGALTGFLAALGLPAAQIPLDLDRAADLYRTMLADRRMLVLLDDARGVDQIRPLLPGGPGCAVVVTSRYGLGGLVARDGAAHLALDVLSPSEAVALLRHTLGARVDAEPEETAELARLCGFLPLALRIAAANLTLRPGRTIAAHVAGLAADDRLDRLAVVGDDETAVRVAFDHSYAALPEEAARLFRLLGLVPGPDFSVAAATALLGAEAGPGLDLLADAHLLLQPVPGRYAFHDLLRLYAAERAAGDDDRDEALGRLVDWYRHGVDAAVRTLDPEAVRLPPATAEPLATSAEALAWLDAELPGLVAVARLAADRGPAEIAWQLTTSLRPHFWRRMCTVEWLAVATAGLDAATAAGDLTGQAAATLCLADLHRLYGRYRVAIDHYTRAAALARSGGWLDGAAVALSNVGTAHFWLGDLAQAAEHYRQGLDVAVSTGREAGEANTLGNLGLVYELQGELGRAVEHHRRALALHRRLGARQKEAVNLANLADTYHQLGRLDVAYDHITQALNLHREVGDRGAEAESLRVLAGIWLDQGKHDRALDRAVEAVALATETGHLPIKTNALNTLGTVRLRRGQAEARDEHEHALRLARAAGTLYAEVVALTGLAACLLHDDPDRARTLAEHALAETDRVAFRIAAAEALTVLLEIHLHTGDHERAAAYGHHALALHRTTGHRLGEARTALLLGHVLEPAAARAAWRRAAALFADVGVPEAAEARALLS